jgi:peptide/nickel transport system substrate-binding protein
VTEYFATRSIRAKGGSGRNTTQFSNAEVDKLLVEGATKLTNEERRPIYQEIQKIVRNELPYLPMFQYTIAQGLKGSLSGFSPSVNVQENCWNAATWYWAS